jgi:tetratricopeptide (TPR) repeat protein
MMLGIVAAFGAGILFMSLRVPSYAQVKAFYALPALMPLCALAAVGWEVLSSRSGGWRFIFAVALFTWAALAGSTFWVRRESPAVKIARGISLADDRRYEEAATSFSAALRLEPQAIEARVHLADALNRLGRHGEASNEVAIAIRDAPENPHVLSAAAINSSVDGRYEESVEYLRKAVKVAPDDPALYAQMATCEGWLGRSQAVRESCLLGLRANPFDANLHEMLAEATASLGDSATAVIHYRQALIFEPGLVAALNNLAWLLAVTPADEMRDGAEAVRLAERACELTHRRQPLLLGTLAAAYAETGRFADAVATAEQARQLALDAGQSDVAETNSRLLELYRANKPFRTPGPNGP